jgi:uncharacterized membrane protein
MKSKCSCNCNYWCYVKFFILFFIFSALGSAIEFSSILIGGKGIFYDQVIFQLFNVRIPLIPLYGLAGLILFVIQGYLYRNKVNLILWGLINTAIIIVIELISGYVSMLTFGSNFWDYSGQFLNYKGIISLQVSLIWLLLSYIFSLVYYFLSKNKIIKN